MITPRFRLSQTDETVTIIIRAPYSNLKNLQVDVDDNVFIFLSSPYYLRLHLPGEIIENDNTKSSYDTDSCEFTFTFDKINSGEDFPDLDLITKLLCPKIEVNENGGGERKITVLTNENSASETKNIFRDENELNEEFGFALAGKRNFRYVSAEFIDVFEIDPTEVDLKERRKLRLQYEQGKFNVDHYLCDFIENDEITEITVQSAPWTTLKIDEIQFTDKELDFLKDLPNVEYKLSEKQVAICHSSLIDILFAYCYDRRTTFFEGSSESGWTMIKLAASFCWLDVFNNPKEALISAFRRSIIYPLYRNFDLSRKILEDVKAIVKLGEKYIIRCLIDMHTIFLQGDCCRYIINNLFIKDYIIYLMKWEKSKWNEVVLKLDALDIEKSDLGLNLKEIEDSVCNKIGNFANLKVADSDSDDDDSDSSTTDSDSVSSSSDESENGDSSSSSSTSI